MEAEEVGMDTEDKLSGFIFMCNQMTKPECYRYRVFALPAGRKHVVERINPGMHLFLFDTDVKLLYGIYLATSTGMLNIEPYAFGGRFPAQVSFKIYQEVIPSGQQIGMESEYYQPSIQKEQDSNSTPKNFASHTCIQQIHILCTEPHVQMLSLGNAI